MIINKKYKYQLKESIDSKIIKKKMAMKKLLTRQGQKCSHVN